MGLKLPSSSAISTTGGTDAAAEFIDANAASLDAINAAKEAASQFSKERAKCVATYPSMDVTTLTKYSDYCLELDSKYASLVQKIYAFNATKFVTVDQANNGTDTANSYAEEADILVARMQDITSTLVAASYKVAIKKTTINCVKGKLIKKVTASKPVCPVGYKKK
jgi:ABC-type transporter Mla subunit MlaD